MALPRRGLASSRDNQNRIIDAVGPETFTFRGLVETIGVIIRKPRPIVCLSPGLGYLVATVIGEMVGDVFLTREEIEGLMRDLLWSPSEPAGTTKLTNWAQRHADSLGLRYTSELARRRKRDVGYENL